MASIRLKWKRRLNSIVVLGERANGRSDEAK
jgi:hypothetical protein